MKESYKKYLMRIEEKKESEENSFVTKPRKNNQNTNSTIVLKSCEDI